MRYSIIFQIGTLAIERSEMARPLWRRYLVRRRKKWSRWSPSNEGPNKIKISTAGIEQLCRKEIAKVQSLMKRPRLQMPLRGYVRVWQLKPVLRAIYDDFYRRLATESSPGLTIEIGGGIGNLKERLAQVVTTDIQFATWLDCVADAQRLPFAADCAANIVMVDVLHHIEFPAIFFREAERMLRPGGRIIMIEPAITWGSTLFYRLFHNEPVRSSADILIEGNATAGRDPYASNQAIPTILATRDRKRFHAQFPHLRIKRVDWFSLAAYPLSGGFQRWTLINAGLARRLLRIESAIEPLFGRFMGFRMMIVIEKISGGARAPD